jgi:hypothetical protein
VHKLRSLSVVFSAAALSTSFLAPAAQQEPTVLGVATFLHIVSDLDQSMEFYHGTLGLELRGTAVSPQAVDSPPVANMYGLPGRQYRAAVLKVPGSTLNIELVQWGPARKPGHEPAADPGAITLILIRPDAASPDSRALSLSVVWRPRASAILRPVRLYDYISFRRVTKKSVSTQLGQIHTGIA